jgi:hypothetical protein
MKNDAKLIEAAILGGLIGAALEALISGDKKNSGLGALAGAVVSASFKANEEALQTNIPLILEENNVLYEVNSKGRKKLIRRLPNNSRQLPKKFTLK